MKILQRKICSEGLVYLLIIKVTVISKATVVSEENKDFKLTIFSDYI